MPVRTATVARDLAVDLKDDVVELRAEGRQPITARAQV